MSRCGKPLKVAVRFTYKGMKRKIERRAELKKYMLRQPLLIKYVSYLLYFVFLILPLYQCTCAFSTVYYVLIM